MKQSKSSILLTVVSLLLSLTVFSSLPEQYPGPLECSRDG